MKIETTAHFTCYNDFSTFKRCVESFVDNLNYDKQKLEIIIVDNGSQNLELIDYIKNFKRDVGSYQYIECLSFSKIQARRIAKGKYFIDIPDDHLFFTNDNWIEEYIYHIENDESVGVVCYCAQAAYRWKKSNNVKEVNKINDNFFRSLLKGYSDYHVMSSETYDKIGEYNYVLGKGPPESYEGEYMRRSLQYNYFRNLPKIPVAIDLNNVKSLNYKVKKSISKKELSEHFKNKLVSNEELIYILDKKSVIVKS